MSILISLGSRNIEGGIDAFVVFVANVANVAARYPMLRFRCDFFTTSYDCEIHKILGKTLYPSPPLQREYTRNL